ncbi:MAG: hypothetical protein H7236_03555, partial [Gemmatimonadaceae bacterium]|nr:hypothetical protein [Caulobacter sp.]
MVGEKLDPKATAAQSDGLAAAFEAALGQGALTPPLHQFVAQAQEDWSAEELPGFTADDIARALIDFWHFGEAASDPAAIRIRPADGGDL